MKTLAIAANTFRESVRERVIFGVTAASALAMLSSWFLVRLAQTERVAVDFGLFVITLNGAALAIVTGAGLLARETERRRVYALLSKPVPRSSVVIGKLLGAFGVSAAATVFLSLLLFGFVYALGGGLRPGIFLSALFTGMELLVLSAMAVFFASFTTSILSTLYSFMFFAICHMIEDIKAFWSAGSEAGRLLAKAVYFLLPNMENFNIKQEVVHNLPVSGLVTAGAAGYALLYVCALAAAAAWIFTRRDFD